MSDGLRKVSKLGVADGAPIEAHHVSHIVDTLNGDAICDVKFSGSLTIDGSTYNSDTVYSNNFQASTALTVKGSTSNQLIFLDKNGSNNIRFRDAGGTVNRGYIGFSGDDLIINNQQGNGLISIYNINEALTIDTSQNVTIPNGSLTVTTGIITGDGSGLTNLDLTGLDARQLSNLPDSSVWSEDGTTATYTGTAVATNFQGNGSGLTNINGNNVSKVANATHADTAGTANSVDGDNVNGAVASATYAATAGTANSVDGDNVNGAVASATNATYATTAGSAPWNGTLENTQAIITNNDSYSGFLLFKDSDYAEIDIAASAGAAPPQTTTTYSADAWIQWQGRTKTIDRTMNHQGEVSYSDYEDKFRMGIDTEGRFRIVRGTSWKGLRIERDSSKIIVDQGLTVSSGGATIAGATTITGATTIAGESTLNGTSTLNGKTTINYSDARPLTIHRTTSGSNNDDEVVIAFNSPDDAEGAIIGIDKTINGGGAKLQASGGNWNKIYVRNTGGGITTNFTTSGKLTVSSGGAAITGASSFSSTLSTGGQLTVSSGGASISGDVSISGWLTVKGATRGITAGDNGGGNNRYPIVATRFARWTWGDTPNLGITGDGSIPLSPETGSWTGTADLAVNEYVKAGGFFASSDERLKEYLDVFIPGEALNTLNEITPKLFKWNELSHASGLTDFGFFAQEVEEVFPFGVVTSKTDNFEDQRSINPIAMVALASAAIKDLSKENNILKDRNRELEDRLKLIEEKLGL